MAAKSEHKESWTTVRSRREKVQWERKEALSQQAKTQSGKRRQGVCSCQYKVLHEEIMMNDDNLESNLLTSSLLKICSLYKLNWRSVLKMCMTGELLIFI